MRTNYQCSLISTSGGGRAYIAIYESGSACEIRLRRLMVWLLEAQWPGCSFELRDQQMLYFDAENAKK